MLMDISSKYIPLIDLIEKEDCELKHMSVHDDVFNMIIEVEDKSAKQGLLFKITDIANPSSSDLKIDFLIKKME